MIKIRAVIITAAMFSVLNISAQEGFSDWEKSYFSKNASSRQQEFVNKVTFPSNIEVPKVKAPRNCRDEKQAWDICLRRSFAAFFTESKSYGYSRQVALVYGLFNLGNYDVFNYQVAVKKQFNDTTWVENTFTALMPLIRESWYLLDKDTKAIYITIIKHTDAYLKTFDYQTETQYFNKLVTSSKPEEFIVKNNNSSSKNEFRKAEAFIYRRIKDANESNGNWNVKWARKMILKLKRSLTIV